MRKLSIILMCAVLSYTSAIQAQEESQTPGALPQLLPTPPSAAKLIQVGLGNINKSTGAANVSIPLYTLKSADLSLPITLSYLSQGNKIEELCSRVGFGWSIDMGGVVTRNVMGMPDERATRPAIPTDLAAGTTTTLYTYLQNGKTTNSVSDLYDTQPDEFYFSFAGHSGKFIINDLGVSEVITHENLKITVTKVANDITIITIITPDGVKYIFGDDACDKTFSDGFLKGANVFSKTAFYLHRIISPTGNTIELTYSSPFNTNSHTGFAETVTTPSADPNDDNSCPAGHFIESRNFSYQNVTNTVVKLNSIYSNGITINFLYEFMPDNSNDVRLKNFFVTNQNMVTVCEYDFSYAVCTGCQAGVPDYPNSLITSVPSVNGRFYLMKVTQPFPYRLDNGDDPHFYDIGYSFDYYSGGSNSVFSQDYFGFDNGKLNQTSIPQPLEPDDFAVSIPWGDRTPDPVYAIGGMLKKITYPTTGWEQFSYEPNTIATMEVVPIPTTINRDVQGIGSNVYGPATMTAYFNSFTPHKSQGVQFTVVPLYEGGCALPCGLCKTMNLIVRDMTAGGTLQLNYTRVGSEGTTPFITTVSVEAEHTYQVETDISGPSCFHTQTVVQYDAGYPYPVPVNHITGGLRVSEISK
ncbi:MAG: hypothetical protein ABI480_13535, partial [Chitinophagaceae bacterium]